MQRGIILLFCKSIKGIIFHTDKELCIYVEGFLAGFKIENNSLLLDYQETLIGIGRLFARIREKEEI